MNEHFFEIDDNCFAKHIIIIACSRRITIEAKIKCSISYSFEMIVIRKQRKNKNVLEIEFSAAFSTI